MSFYLTLSSNVDSFKVFGLANKISEFKTKLGRNIDLDSNWSVGLAEITYTKSWYNILESHKVSLFDELGKIYTATNDIDDDKFTISSGFYETTQKLINEINRILGSFTSIKAPKLHYNEINNCVTVEAGKIEKAIKIYPYFGTEIEDILGLRDRDIKRTYYNHISNESGIAEYVFKGDDIYRQDKFRAFHPVEINGGYHSLYLYTDIVYPSLVGDSFAQLLRVIEVPRKYKFGDTVHLNYDRPHYMPVMLNNFETIEISIKDDTNSLIPFMFGRCTVVLHFKKSI